MTREEKVKALKEKILDEISKKIPECIEILSISKDNKKKFYVFSMTLSTYLYLEKKIIENYPLFEEINYNKYTVTDQTLNMLLTKEYILPPFVFEFFDKFINDEYWEFEYFTTLERAAFNG